MARHFKNGLEYFSHDTTMKDDTKIKLLKAKFGIYGYGVYNLILEDIYKESYYLKINEDYILLFESENNIPEGDFMKVILFMISKGLFDNAYYEKYSILTSKRIQQNYLRGCTRRKNVTLVKQYLLINPDEVLNETEKKATTIIYDNINTKSDNINVSINSQSKVKETEIETEKEIERKTKKNLPEKTPALHSEIIKSFTDYYFKAKNVEYIFNGGKDGTATKQIITKLKKICSPDKQTDEDISKAFQYMISNITDTWILDNLDLPVINSKFNQIISTIKNGKSTNNDTGQTKGFDIRKNSWIAGTLENAIQLTRENSN